MLLRLLRLVALGVAVPAFASCGGSDDGEEGSGGSGGAGGGSGGSGSGVCAAPDCGGCQSCFDACVCATGAVDTCPEVCASSGGAGGAGGTGGVGGGGTGGAAGGGVGGAGGTGGAGGPAPTALPAPTGACPDFVGATITVSPAGLAPRPVDIWVGGGGGPLVFYWHGTGSSPTIANFALPIADITALGGVVVAPHSDPASGQWPWYLTVPFNAPDHDLRVADEIVACAIEKVGIDTRRIHSTGMSAGGLHTSQMSYLRSNYLASVATFSGGIIGFAPQALDPSNRFAAMVWHGGPTDSVFGQDFPGLSAAYKNDLVGKGHFALLCDHGGGHLPPTSHTAAILQFLMDHPYGADPSPYVGGLPPGIAGICVP